MGVNTMERVDAHLGGAGIPKLNSLIGAARYKEVVLVAPLCRKHLSFCHVVEHNVASTWDLSTIDFVPLPLMLDLTSCWRWVRAR